MRKFFTAFILFCAVAIFQVQAQSNDQRTLNTKIADLLARMPAPDAKKSSMDMQEMAEWRAEGLEDMCAMLEPAGKGDNTALQYALSAFAHYVSRPGNGELKEWAVTGFGESLNKTADKENKAFIIRQLQTIGHGAAVNYLSPYLTDERLCDPAARALVKINTPAARKALLDALQTATGNNQLTLVEALGDCRFNEAVGAIAALANSGDKKLVKLSLYALARIADPASESLLASAAQKSGFVYDETGAVQAYLDYAAQLYASGESALAEKIADSVLQKAAADSQAPARTAALKILSSIQKEKSVPLLIAAMKDPNPKYREAALQFAEKYSGNESIALWVKQLNSSSDPVKAGILRMLGRTGNRTALPALENALQSKDESVRMAAIPGAGRIGGGDALSALFNLMKKGNPGEVQAISQTIQGMKGPDLMRQVGNAIPSMPTANAQAALIRILAGRSASDRLYDVMPLLKSKDKEVRQASYAALKNMAGPETLPVLFNLLVNASGTAEVKSVQDAIVSATAGIKNKNRRVPVVEAEMIKKPANQHLYYDILSGIGDQRAMEVLMNLYNNGDEQTKHDVAVSLAACKEEAAAVHLLQICRNATGADYFDQALAGYVQLSHSGFPPEERLLKLRNAMDIAQTVQQKQNILKELGNCKTYPALLYTGKFMDDDSLQQEAARVVMRIALSDNEWYGDTVRSLLEKSSALLSGPDADYERQAIAKHLADLPAGEGFVPLFNGKDLTGWKGLLGNPIQRAKADSEMLAKMQVVADARMRSAWYVKDGELVFSGKGDNLCTQKEYGDFEMYVDWKINKNGDAGIYLRGSPQVQIWDTSRTDVGAQVGSGGLYNNVVNESKPLKLADNAIGEWNNFHIIMKGDRVTVYLNGVLVVDNTILENYWDRKLPIFPVEQIELQAHGNLVYYRDIYIKELPRVLPDTLSEAERKEGFKMLFDGTNMNEWTGNTKEYVTEGGNIVVHPENGGHGNLYTKDEYSDFDFRFEFQLTPGANNGIGIRAPLEGDAAYVGMEIQVLDNEAPIYKDLHVYQYHGSVYGVIPAKRGFLKPLGEWNSEEIIAKGNKITVILNGTVILDGDIAEASQNGTLDGKDHPGLKRTSGHIGFLGHGDVVRFRNVRIKPITDKPAGK